MEQFVLVLHVLISITLIGLILIQHGKGAEAGTSLGGASASQTIFGSQGSGNFITRLTAIFVSLFFMSSLTLGYLTVRETKPSDLDTLIEQVHVKQQIEAGNILQNDDIPVNTP
jgi:preprotein translocase subunit SecG